MDLAIGIVCARCETYATLGTTACGACGHALALETASMDLAPSRPEPSPVPSPEQVTQAKAAPHSTPRKQSLEELMDQAKNFVCRSCSTAVPLGHKFCGRCGAAVPPEILQARTQFFGQLQAPGKAKLILIRGEGVEGLSYQLNAEQHIVGRAGQLVFPDDPFVSPRHANFIENDGGASSADCVALMAEARRRVRERHGIELEHKVRFLGPLGLPPA